jgi:CubicO group peptidase (beta-lactamase class C family)
MQGLSALPTLIFSEPAYQQIHSVLVSQGTETVFEGYFQGYNAQIQHEAQSVTKSIQSLLVGIAIDKKFIPHLDVKIKDYFPQYPHIDWQAGKDKITLRHLLTMTAGFAWNEGEVSYSAYYLNDASLQMMQDDWVQYALAKPLKHEPGTTFAYSSASPILISHILREATKLPQELFALHYFYMPLGITEFTYQQCPHDTDILADVDILPTDLLKIGQMMLQEGRYGAHQIVSQAWIRQSLTPQVQFKTAGKAYGYMWWLDYLTMPTQEPLAYYYAWGIGGQHIFVVPTYQLVVVTTGGDYSVTLPNQPFELLQKYILPAF